MEQLMIYLKMEYKTLFLKNQYNSFINLKQIDVLNLKTSTIDCKVDCVQSLANFALKAKARDALFDNLKGITEVVDDELKQMKNAGKVGLLHELIFILLCRVLDYKFIARELLELLDQDVEMSFFLIERVLTVFIYN